MLLVFAVESESENFLMLLVLASLRVVLSFRQSPRASWITGSKFISKARLVSRKNVMNMVRGNYRWQLLTRAQELIDPFPTQSKHKLKNPPELLSPQVCDARGHAWRQTCSTCWSAAWRLRAPVLTWWICFLFSQDLKLVSVSAMPCSIQIYQFKLARIQQEC